MRRLGGRSLDLPYRVRRLPLASKIVSAVGRVDYVRVRVRDGRIEPPAVSGASAPPSRFFSQIRGVPSRADVNATSRPSGLHAGYAFDPNPCVSRRSEPPLAFAALVLGVVAASRFFALAHSPGEIDEAIFAGAVTRFDLFDLSPQAPGFPVWILIGRALLPLCVTPFNALATASTLLAACCGTQLPPSVATTRSRARSRACKADWSPASAVQSAGNS